MKLVAYSEVPKNPMPYLHIGYTAAATLTAKESILGVIFAGLVIGIFLYAKGKKVLALVAAIITLCVVYLAIQYIRSSGIFDPSPVVTSF